MNLAPGKQHPFGSCAMFQQYHHEVIQKRVGEILADTYFDNLTKTLAQKQTEKI
jgi:hypothetical protein